MPPFDAQIIQNGTLFKILAKAGGNPQLFWIVLDAYVQPTDENPWLATSSVHELGGGRFLLEMDGHPNVWDYGGPAFESSGNVVAAMCAGTTGIVKF